MALDGASPGPVTVASSAFSKWLQDLENDYANALCLGYCLQILASFIAYWIVLSAHILKPHTKRCKTSNAPWTEVLAYIVGFSTFLASCYRSSWALDVYESSLDIVRLASEGLWTLAVLCCLLTQLFEIQRGPRLFTFFFWLTSIMGLSPIAYIYIVCCEDFARTYVNSTCTTLYLAAFMLTWEGFRRRDPQINYKASNNDIGTINVFEEEIPLADEASIFSWLSFYWIWPLIKKGQQHTLYPEDWPAFQRDANSQYASSKFERLWDEESVKTPPSLMQVFRRLIWKELLISGVFYAIGCILLPSASPVALYLFIQFLDRRQIDPDLPILEGSLLALAIALAPILEVVTKAAARFIIRNASIKLEAATINVLYQRIFARHSEVQARQSGDVINQISNDITTIDEFMHSKYSSIHDIWVMPILLAIYMAFLVKLIGAYALIPFIMFIGMMYALVYWGAYIATIFSRSVVGRGERSKLELDILQSVKAIKLASWGDSFQEKLLSGRRTDEIPFHVRYLYLDSVTLGIGEHFPVIATVAALGCFALWSGRKVTPEIAFPVWAMLSGLEIPLSFFRGWLTNFNHTLQALQRIQSMYLDVQQDKNTILEDESSKQALVQIEKGFFAYQTCKDDVLRNIDFQTTTKDFHAIIGRVGAGKSSLCKSILGEMRPTRGRVAKSGSVAYAAQKPWIFSNTIRENILFGNRWDPDTYIATIKACALESDLSLMPDGDKSFVGEEGLQLSGGQKARISLARAVYAQADLYIIDDILAAVDQHTANHLINEVLGSQGILKDKTRIVVSNHIPAIRAAEHITLLDNGTIVESSKGDNIDKQSKIENFLKHTGEMEILDSNETQFGATNAEVTNKMASRETGYNIEERKRIGSFSNFYRFMKDMGTVEVVIYFILMATAFMPFYLVPIWLQYWTARNVQFDNNGRIDIWSIIGIALFLLGAVTLSVQLMYFVTMRNKASMKLYSDMIIALVRSPMSFFETVNSGQIMGRLSGDFHDVDVDLHYCLNMTAAGWVMSAQVLIYMATINPAMIPAIIVLMSVCIIACRYSLAPASQLRRSECDTRSAIYGQIKESSDGMNTIRAYGKSHYFSQVFKHKVDLHLQAAYTVFTCNMWLYVRVNTYACLLAAIIPFNAIWRLYHHKEISTPAVASAMSIVLNLAIMLRQAVNRTCDLAIKLVALDRCLEYADLPAEPDEPTYEPKPSWPQAGRIVFKDFGLRYRPELPFALQNINLVIKPSQKIGFVGRTGAGKSSIIMGLFRIVNAAHGQILIDGVDIGTISLSRLRESLAIIPQDSAVFKGSIRYNLDFEEQHDDEELWESLERCQLRKYIESLPEGLHTEVGEGGSKLSVGQRQLLSIARTFLHPSKILVLDEATASVDAETDALIQRAIREISKSRTVLTIAHRINTVLNSDIIVVLQEGRVAETGPPQELLKKQGLFYALAKDAKVIH